MIDLRLGNCLDVMKSMSDNIGIEMSEEYLKIAEARINSVHQEGLI